jgi:hypothetical protein
MYRPEVVPMQVLVAQASIETLDAGVLVWFARLDVAQPDGFT